MGTSNYLDEKTTHHGSRTPRENELKSRVADDGSGAQGAYNKENHCDAEIPLLQKPILLFAPPRTNLDSDMSMSDDGDFVANSFPNIIVALDMSLANSPGATRNGHSSPMNGDAHTG